MCTTPWSPSPHTLTRHATSHARSHSLTPRSALMPRTVSPHASALSLALSGAVRASRDNRHPDMRQFSVGREDG